MSSLTSPSTSAGIPLGKSPPKERPKQSSLFPGVAISERDGGHTLKTTRSQLSLEWLSQFPSAQTAVPSPPTRPSTSTSGEHNVRVDDAAAADEREQLKELLGLIERLKNLLTPATERLLRLRGTLKALKEQVAVSAAPGNTPAGLSISSVSMADTLPSVRLCVAGTSDEAMEEVFQFIVHRDPPGHRGSTGNAVSGGCSPAVHSASGSGGRLPTPDIGQSTFSQVSPCSNGGRRRSRFDSGGVSAGTNAVTQTGHPGGSASSVWPSGPVAFGEEGKTVSAGGSSLRFPSTPPLAPSLMSATQATVHDTQSPSGARQPGSPGVTEMPSLDQFPLPMMHSRISSGGYAGGTRVVRDNPNTPYHHPKGTSLPPLPTAASTATTPTGQPGAGGGGGSVDRLPSVAGATATHEVHQQGTLSPPLLPSAGSLGCSLSTTPTPPLPAAPANHHMRRARSTPSIESPCRGDPASIVTTTDAEGMGCSLHMRPPSQMMLRNTAPSAEMGSDGVNASPSTTSMSLSSTMPDLSVTPPPLPGFSTLATLEVSGASLRTPSSPPNASLAASPQSPMRQSMGTALTVNQASEANKKAAVSRFRRRARGSQVFAGLSSLPFSEFSSLPTPIMINSIDRTLSQCSEVMEQQLLPHPHHHRPRPNGSAAFATSRFVTLPTPFSSQARRGKQNSAGRSFREDSAILSRVSSFAPSAMRFGQRARRRVLSLTQAQLCLSAWDLFHRGHMGSRVQTAFQATLAASGLSSPIGLRSFAEQRNRQATSGLRSLMSGSGSRIGVSQHQEHSSPLRSAMVTSEVSSHMLSGSQWLVSTSEDGILRHDALPSAAQPTVSSRATPVSTTADYAFFCVPYAAVERGLGSEVNRGSSSSATSDLGVGPGGVNTSVGVGGEMQEVEAVLDILFGIFRGGAHLRSKDQEQPPIPHNATAGAKSILVTANTSACGNAAHSTAVMLSASSSVHDVEATPSQNAGCIGDGNTDCISDEPRNGRGVPHPTQSVPGPQRVAGARSLKTARPRIHSENPTTHGVVSPRIRISSLDSPTAADISFSSEQRYPGERLDKHRAPSSPQSSDLAGLPYASSDEWLLPLRQALVDRTIFLLMKSNQQDTPTPSRGPGSTTCGREKEVVERFIAFAKAHYGVTVQPWRVIVFTSRDATRARNLMLAVYAQRLQHQQKGKNRLNTSSRVVDEAPSQMVRATGTGESHAEGETATRESLNSLPLSPLVSACIGSEAPVVANPSLAKTPPDISFLSTSRLTLESSVDGGDERRAHIFAGGRWHHSEGVQRGSGDLLFTLLTQGLNVPGLSVALEEYKPLLEYQVASPLLLHSVAGGEKVAPVPPPGSRSQAHLPSGVARASVSANFEGRQAVVDTTRQSSGTASSLGTVERAAPMDASEVDAESSVVAAAFTHAHDVVWCTSGAARVYGALGFFQHAASTHRVSKTGFLLMAWSWQLSALLPAIIDDTRSRYDQLQLNGVHARQKLQNVRQSLALHRSTSPAKSVCTLEKRLQEGFGEMTQRFLRDLRRVFLMTAASTADPALSPAAGGSPSPRTATTSQKCESSRKQVPPFVPLDALLVYDTPSLREAYRRLAGAIRRFHAFYLGGQFDFDEQMVRKSTDTKRDVSREGKSLQSLGPLSVYEQRYAAIRDAEHLSVSQRSSPPGSPKDTAGRPHPALSTAPRPLCSAGTQPSDRATPSTASTPNPPNPRCSLPVGAAATSVTPLRAEYETSVVKKGLELRTRSQHTSPAANAAQTAISLRGGPTLQRCTRHGEAAATPDDKVMQGGGDGQAQRGRLPQKLPVVAVRGAPRQDCTVPGEHSPQSGGKSSTVDCPSRRSGDQLQGLRLHMERQLITYVSQINTEIINFFLATCVAAIPHLQHDCVVAELTRVKNAQLEIVSSFTKAVRGRRDAAIAVSQLYTQLDEWISNMSHLVSMVRSRPYIEKFITQLRAVLCEDVVRALAVFRGGEKGSQEVEGQMRQDVGIPCSSPGADVSSSNGTSGQLTGSSQPGSGDSVRTGRVGGRAVTPPNTSGRPPVLASKSLAVEVGHRSARMVRYFTRLICSQNVGKGNPVSGSCTLPHSQRNGMFGEMLASPSPSRSLRSVHAGSPTAKSPHWAARSKRDGGGGGGDSGGGGGGRLLGLSISLSNMSAMWSREEERCRVEGATHGHGAGTLIDNATSEEPFFADLSSSPMAAVFTEALTMLEASHSAASLPPLHTSPVQATPDTDPRPMTLDVDAPALIKPNPASCIRATGARTPAVCSPSGTALTSHVSAESTSRVGAAVDSYVKVESSAWHKKLAQWRAVMSETERPSGDASGAPLLWILLDVWDETLLRMPYGLLLEVDMPRYAESLNGLSADLLDTQKSWVSLCRDSLTTIERQLKALRGDIAKMCHEHGEVRVGYVQELSAIFDAASRLVASSAMTPEVRASSIYKFPVSSTET